MLKLTKHILIILSASLLCTILFFYASDEARHLQRDPQVLLNRYYLLHESNPSAARRALTLLLQQNPHNTIALQEMSQLYIKEHNSTAALKLVRTLHQLNPKNRQHLFQLGSLYYEHGNWDKAYPLLQQLKKDRYWSAQARELLHCMRSFIPTYTQNATTQFAVMAVNNATILAKPTHNIIQHSTVEQSIPSTEYQLMSRFYTLKQINKNAAWELIQHIITRYPQNSNALKEGAFLALELHHKAQAIRYFKRAYALTKDPHLAMQLGYLYNDSVQTKAHTNNNYWSYHYFNEASKTLAKEQQLQAEQAKSTIAGYQTKALPTPYFGEFFFAPFSQSRFDLTVVPMIGRLGIEQNNRWRSKTYFVFRRTEDNKSINAGQVPQIYEDNVQVIGVGAQASPLPLIPLTAFAEIGKAYDLIDQNRDRWRNDVRGGFIFFNEFGARPTYYDTVVTNFAYYSALYADASYFSRYDNNIIANAKTHQGIRLLQYHSSMVNLYVTGRVIEDSNRDFFNNIAEVGPGIGFIPSNRYKLEVRFEHINGVYLPVGGNTNPYSKYYLNNTVQLLFYTKF